MIGIILAGGEATRMGGGDKSLLPIAGRTCLERVADAMRPQCEALCLSANGDPARFASYGLPVVADGRADRAGPLAGILAGLDHVAATYPGAAFMVSVPADAPFLPPDLVARLEDRRVADRAAIVRASSRDRVHHTVALWAVALREDLRHVLEREGLRRVEAFADRHPVATVAWPAIPRDPFFNLNSPEDLAAAERLLPGSGQI